MQFEYSINSIIWNIKVVEEKFEEINHKIILNLINKMLFFLEIILKTKEGSTKY